MQAWISNYVAHKSRDSVISNINLEVHTLKFQSIGDGVWITCWEQEGQIYSKIAFFDKIDNFLILDVRKSASTLLELFLTQGCAIYQRLTTNNQR